jgi:hypothetical protein
MVRIMKTALAVAVLLVLAAPAAAQVEKKATGEYSATASIGTPSGTRSMAFDVVVSSPRSLAEILPLKKVLEDGGQQALVNAIRGSGQGQVKLGALVYPIDLVMAEKIEDGWRYLVVTTRPIKYTESEEDGGASLNYPFAVFAWDWTDFGSSDGTIYTRASLSIDPDGHVQVSQYDGDPGTLSDIRRIN